MISEGLFKEYEETIAFVQQLIRRSQYIDAGSPHTYTIIAVLMLIEELRKDKDVKDKQPGEKQPDWSLFVNETKKSDIIQYLSTFGYDERQAIYRIDKAVADGLLQKTGHGLLRSEKHRTGEIPTILPLQER